MPTRLAFLAINTGGKWRFLTFLGFNPSQRISRRCLTRLLAPRRIGIRTTKFALDARLSNQAVLPALTKTSSLWSLTGKGWKWLMVDATK